MTSCAKLYPKRRLRIQNRPAGCVLSRTYSSKQQKVPQVRLRKQGVPVSSATIQSEHNPSGFYSFGAHGDRISAPSGDLGDTISRLLVDSPPRPPSLNPTSSSANKYARPSRLYSEQKEIRARPVSGSPVFRNSLTSGPRGSFTSTVQSLEDSARTRHLSSARVLTYSQVSQLMGSLNWASGLIPLGRLYLRPLQRHFHSLGLTDRFTPPRRSNPMVLANLLQQWQDPRFLTLGIPIRMFQADLRIFTDVSATLSNSHLPRFMSPIPEPRALAVDALSQDWQGRSTYMFPPFPLLSKVNAEASIHSGGRGNSSSPLVANSIVVSTSTTSLCGTPPSSPLPSGSSVPAGPEVRLGRKVVPSARMEALMRHYKAAGFSEEVSRLTAAPRRPSTNRVPMYDDRWLRFARWAAGQGFDPLDPTAAQIASFLFTLFDTHGLSPQTVKGYRTCLGSVRNCTGKAKVVLHKTISDMIASMELQRPRITPVLPQWDLGVVLVALSKSPYEPLREASFKHLTLKTVFLLAMASAGRRSELYALRFDQNYIQFKLKGAGVSLYFSPAFMCKNQKPNQVNDPWYIPANPTGKPEFGTPNCPVRVLRYYHRYLIGHPELRKDRHRLFCPSQGQ